MERSTTGGHAYFEMHQDWLAQRSGMNVKGAGDYFDEKIAPVLEAMEMQRGYAIIRLSAPE